MNNSRTWVYDLETYLAAFTFTIIRADGKQMKTFECSERKNEIDRVFKCLDYLHEHGCDLVGFNNTGFDYPILHQIIARRDSLPKSGKSIAKYVYTLAQRQIDSFKGDNRFGSTVKSSDEYVRQIDLYKINHFDNKAKATSLKLLEFNMRMDNIEDLPFAVDAELTSEQIDKLIQYNQHDVKATLQFFNESLPAVDFRKTLTVRYGRSFLNHNDGKIGKDYFQMRLEELGVQLYTHKNGQRVMKQTKRAVIDIGDCLFDYYDFKEPAFIAIKDWFAKQKIRETKGVFTDIDESLLGEVAKHAVLQKKKQKFKQKPSEQEISLFKKEHPLGWVEEEELKATEYLFDAEGNHVMQHPLDEESVPDLTKKAKKVRVPKKSYWGCYNVAETLNVVVNGFKFDYGVGGIHGSLTDIVVKETKSWGVVDLDVASYYPNLAIANKIYPEHLGKQFCDIYQDVFEQRKSYPKGSPENAMLKLALNSVYGDSNNQYSVFYDPAYTMSICVNGQLLLCQLVDMFTQSGIDYKMVAINTDGLTFCVKREDDEKAMLVVKNWETITKLQMERADYSKMHIRDVNNYLSVYTNGKTKRKGAYQYEGLEWHKNQSALVIPMAAEAKMLHNIELLDFIKAHFNKGNIFDFMLRTKVPRSSKLVLEFEDGRVEKQQNICRYYPSNNGGSLVKVMPALEGKEQEGDRRLGIEVGWKVKTCNNMKDFDGDINFDYYVAEATKLVV